MLIDDLLDGLGMRETDELARLVRALAEDREIGVLMAVSDPEAALSSHRVLSLADGRLSTLSAIAEVSQQSPGADSPPLSPAVNASQQSFENVIDFPRSSAPSRRDARRR